MQIFDLKRFRKENNLTQKDLADLLGVNQVFISRVEKGEKQFSQEKMVILQSKYGYITNYLKEEEAEAVSIPDATPQDLLFAGADAFSRQIVQMMNEKLIAPYSLLIEKDKEIEKLNRHIGKLEAQIENSKKVDAQEVSAAKCADAV